MASVLSDIWFSLSDESVMVIVTANLTTNWQCLKFLSLKNGDTPYFCAKVSNYLTISETVVWGLAGWTGWSCWTCWMDLGVVREC